MATLLERDSLDLVQTTHFKDGLLFVLPDFQEVEQCSRVFRGHAPQTTMVLLQGCFYYCAT